MNYNVAQDCGRSYACSTEIKLAAVQFAAEYQQLQINENTVHNATKSSLTANSHYCG
jgi:hypothetical protein